MRRGRATAAVIGQAKSNVENPSPASVSRPPARPVARRCGQRLPAAAVGELGGDVRITAIGGADQPAYDATFVDVAHAPGARELHVAFNADSGTGGTVDGEIEAWVQRVAAGSGVLAGDPERVSDMGPTGTFNYQTSLVAIAHAPANDLSLVVWRGDDDGAGLVDNEFEIWGQLTYGLIPLFADGFASNDTGQWSATVPP